MKKLNLKQKIQVWFYSFHKPIEDSFIVWQEVIFNSENPERLWEDLSFFHLFNEDFWDWYELESIKSWEFLDN